MQANADTSEVLNPMFAEGRNSLTPKGTSDAADKLLVKKEVDRMMKEAANFKKSKASLLKTGMFIAFGVAGASVVLNMIQGIALAVMMPMKTVEPFLLMVDKESGHVSIMQPLSDPLPTYGKVLDDHHLRTFVIARESHDWGLAQLYFDTVKSFSYEGTSTYNEYTTFLYSDKSPLAMLGDKARVVVGINSDPVIDEKTSTAVVRFSKTVMGQDGKPIVNIPVTYYIATIKYEYPNPKLKPEERRLNPLGMKIASYQVVQENGGR